MTPLLLVGKRTDTTFDGNYWSDNGEPDLDGDGRSDRPFRLSNVFDHMRGNLTAADLMAPGFAAAAVSAAERAFPVLDPVGLVDRSPLARPPSLPAVPRADDRPSRASIGGISVSALALVMGLAGLRGGLRGLRGAGGSR
jgi:nitrous oxidase accessory protein